VSAATEVRKLGGRILAVPLDALTTPCNGDTMTDRYWVVRDGCVLFWQGYGNKRGWSAQCNHDERITEKVLAKLYPGASIEFVPVAYVGPWDEDYGHVLTRGLLDAAEAHAASNEAPA
jgi:hypothetical protein